MGKPGPGQCLPSSADVACWADRHPVHPGKSTFLEAIAGGVGSPTIGGKSVARDGTLIQARRLAEQMRFAWAKKTRRGFFLRAEDFFNFTKRLRAMGKELDDLAAYRRRL